MKRYSAERKEAILRQMMPPTNKPIAALAREHGISDQTLYNWRRNLKELGVAVPGNGRNAEEWSSQDKFNVVLETAGLNEAELAQYCRGKGLFIEQLAAWRNACQEANANTTESNREQRERSKADRKRIKQLEKELQRKRWLSTKMSRQLMLLSLEPRGCAGFRRGLRRTSSCNTQ